MTHKSDETLLALLVEFLPTHGCWPDGVVAMVQDGDQRVLFCGSGYNVRFSKPHDGWMAENPGGWGKDCACFSKQIQHGIHLAADYETAIVSATDFYKALKRAGWKAFPGDQVVPDDAVVEVIYDNHEYEATEARGIRWPSVDFWREVESVAEPASDVEEDAKEWGGVGFPKAGQRCMVKIGKGTYEPCEILYSDKAVGVSFRYLKEGYPHSIDCVSAKAAKDYFHPFNGTEPRMMVWDGKGKPPVGVPIEMKHKRAKADWAKPGFNVATLSYVGREVFIHDTGSHELFGALDDYEFRPHETEEDKAARIKEEAIDILAEVAGGLTGADEVYRMIEAGLVPGIKIDK